MPKGIIGLGMWCVDTTYKINTLPQRGKLEPIIESFQCVGGGPSNVLTDLRSLGFKYPMIAMGSIGVDENASYIKKHCQQNAIETKFLKSTHKAPTVLFPQLLFAGGITQLGKIEQLLKRGIFPSRQPAENLADLSAQVASLRMGPKPWRPKHSNSGPRKASSKSPKIPIGTDITACACSPIPVGNCTSATCAITPSAM